MAKSRKQEELLASLAEVREDPTSDAGMKVLGQILKSKSAIAIAQAAKVIGDAEIRSLIPDLVACFPQFMSRPAETDPGCNAKRRIAEALYRMEYADETLFLQGIHHVQPEPVWGGTTDTAPGLRGMCALGLVRLHYPQVMTELADLLADPEPEARIGAVRAIAYTSDPQAVPLLRFKVHTGDIDSQVMSECFIALLQLAPQASLPFVGRFLNGASAEIAEMAALAIGESRLPEAFSILHHGWEHCRPTELRKAFLFAIAMLRQDAAFDFLLDLVQSGKPMDRDGAIAALQIYQYDEALWQRVEQAMRQP
ncbi:MAG: HEAT repeat domain-containing protein [Oculatellaceae cyanobacterium Prado106]|jgi:hypothetical protein|nr:HEAT repeat domain-containing protein [Oculatellaceae cyanobacterium Prado106]